LGNYCDGNRCSQVGVFIVADYFEIDFFDVETDKSGDAIALRYEVQGRQFVHLVDGGYQATGPSIVANINKYYCTNRIDNLVVTHCDQDHTGGLAHVLENMEVGTLWMLRPWLYAEELLPRFATYNDIDRLRSRLRAIYSSLKGLETIAIRRGVQILEPFQDARIGAFTVLAPARARYLDLIVDSDKTPESVEEAEATAMDKLHWLLVETAKKAASMIVGAWNQEIFPADSTSSENEMSVVQAATLSGTKIVLTGDAGRSALADAADFADRLGFGLPGVDRIQIPHHGSRRNVSTELLDRWLGPRLAQQPVPGQETFTAIVSSAKADLDHPRNAVVRAFMHRGAKVIMTESQHVRTSGGNAPVRDNWSACTPATYPSTMEE
jgi:beta-lactamase superfamily II metal-dependent hydrolase